MEDDRQQDASREDSLQPAQEEPSEEAPQARSDESGLADAEKDDLPKPIKERLGRQEKRHRKEMRRLQDELENLQSFANTPRAQNDSSAHDLDLSSMSEEQRIQHAVKLALDVRDKQALQAEQANKFAYLKEQQRKLRDQLDSGSDKYDDFDDVVRSPDAPFTDAMREMAMVLPNPTDVLYHLGKNREELRRVSKLHPLDQGRELTKLSFAMLNDGKGLPTSAKSMSTIKGSPQSSPISKNASVSDLRKMLKSGWK